MARSAFVGLLIVLLGSLGLHCAMSECVQERGCHPASADTSSLLQSNVRVGGQEEGDAEGIDEAAAEAQVEETESDGAEPEIIEDGESEEEEAVQTEEADSDGAELEIVGERELEEEAAIQTVGGVWEEQFYISGMRSCPNLIGMAPKKLRSISQPNYANTGSTWSGFSARDNFAVRWTGYVKIQNGGSYYFYTYSDDGSKLFIDNRLVVNNDGLHGWRGKYARTTINSGEKPLRLEFFERGGHAGIRVYYKGGDTGGRMVIPSAGALTRDSQFKPPPTPAPPPPGTKVCGFESGSKPYCGVWTDSRSDKFDWTRKNGRTPSWGTGPSSAKQGSYYLFIETSWPRRSGDTAILSATNIALKQNAYLKFAYHMYGSSMGSLQVMVDDAPVLTYSGNKGNQWRTGSVDLSRFAGRTVSLGFVGRRGRSWQGDLAIDDIELFEGATPTTTVPPTTQAPTKPPVPPGFIKKIDEISKNMDLIAKLLMQLFSTTTAPPVSGGLN